MSGQLVLLVKILTLCLKVCFKSFGGKPDANFPWGSVTRAENLVFVWSITVIAIWFSGPCKQPLTSSAPSRDSNYKTFKVLIDISCSKTFFNKIISSLYFPGHSLNGDKIFFNLCLFSQFLFIYVQEEDLKIENFTHHHACVWLPDDSRHLKLLQEKRDSAGHKKSVSRPKQQQHSA